MNRALRKKQSRLDFPSKIKKPNLDRVENLKPFEPNDSIKLNADLIVLSKNTFKIAFEWYDFQSQIQLPKEPNNGRHHDLWKQTCFEVFLRCKNQKNYYEINLSPTGAWNVYKFQDYRTPQPPIEFQGVEKVKIEFSNTKIISELVVNELDLSKLEVSICAVLLLKDGRTTYWSTCHADKKPNFHHVNSFTIERSSP